MAGSQSSQGGQKRRVEALRPVTIKQLNEAQQPNPDADFLIDDVDIGQVRTQLFLQLVRCQGLGEEMGGCSRVVSQGLEGRCWRRRRGRRLNDGSTDVASPSLSHI